jgi:hypothetical protein
MEFLRFGSHIPGNYWGCCACCIIQNFNTNPDDKASIQMVYGDSNDIIVDPDGVKGELFAGPTYRDIFWQRIRVGTFDVRPMPNHGFFAILTKSQVGSNNGKKWLAILKEAGFEFIRTVDNSVYTGAGLKPEVGHSHPNYIFGLFRNIGNGAIKDPFTPPKEWTDLPSVKTEARSMLFADADDISALPGGELAALASKQQAEDRAIWDSHEPRPFMSKEELEAEGIIPTLAGQRDFFRLRYNKPIFGPQTQDERNETIERLKAALASSPAGRVESIESCLDDECEDDDEDVIIDITDDPF